jgi:predicted permease
MIWISRLFRRKQLERELDRELSYHVERQIQDLVDRGLTREEAAREARLAFGGVTQIKEAARDARGTGWVEDLFRDLRHGCRLLRRMPVFSSVAILSIALGTGATTAVFTLIDRAILRDLPVRKPQELVELIRYFGPNRSNHAYPHFEQLRSELRSFDGLIAESLLGELDVSIDGQPETATIEMVTGDYYRVLGIEAVIGRALTADDDRTPGAHPVAVISHRYWERRFGSDPAVIGKSIRRLSTLFTIVGVAPRGFEGVVFGRVADITMPVSMVAEARGGGPGPWLRDPARHWLAAMGRLKPGVRRPEAAAEVKGRFAAIAAQEAGETNDQRRKTALLAQRMELQPARNGIDDWRRDLSEPLAILMATVALVLLLACANVANLLLTKSAARQREIAVRLAVGAGRGRVARQMISEGLLLSLAGGALGVALAYALATALVTMLANGGPPVALTTTPDARVLAFALAVSVVSCLLFSLAPAVQAMRANVQPVLAEVRAARWTLGRTLVVAQVAISVILLIGAGLFGRSLFKMRSQDTGFRERGVVLFSTNLSRLGYPSERLEPLWERLRKAVEATPGVEAATMSTVPPVSGGSGWDAKIRVDGYTHAPGQSNISHGNRVGPSYFRTYGAPILTGRDFTERDLSSAEGVAIVNESFARAYLGTASPLGKRIGPDYPGFTQWHEIVGVVRDMKYESIRKAAPRAVYFPIGQIPADNATFALRTSRDPASLIAGIKAAVPRVDPAGRAQNIRTMESHVSRSLLTERMLATLGASFAGLAVLLAAIGIYGVTAYQVARRRREIGIRMAVGASAGRVVGMILRQTAALALAGCAIGAAGAWTLSRLAAGVLFEIDPADPLTFTMAIASLLLVAVGASFLPGRSASHTNPVETLRAE